MESIQKNHNRKKLILGSSAGVLTLLLAVGIIFLWPRIGHLPIPSGAPLVLDIHTISPLHKPYDGQSQLGFRKIKDDELPSNLESPPYQNCPIWLAGDLGASTVVPLPVPPEVQNTSPNWRDKYDSNRPSCIKNREVLWYVVRSPVAASVKIKDAATFLAWVAEMRNGTTTASTFIKTVFEPLKEALNLQIPASEKGGIKSYLINEAVSSALSADAIIHFDRWRKRTGYIFSFDSKKPSLAREALNALVMRSGWRSYKIKGSNISIVETHFQSGTLFVAENNGRSYIAQDLSGLINLFDEGELIFKPEDQSAEKQRETLSLTIRTGAWFDRLQSILFADSNAELNLAVDLHPNVEMPFSISLPNRGIMSSLSSKGTGHSWQVIPHDIFAAVSSSWLVPKTLSVASMQDRIKNGAKAWEAQSKELLEISFVWDFDSDEDPAAPITDAVAIILDRPTSAGMWPIANLSKSTNVECNNGKTLISTASDKLRQRLIESCEGRNPSLANSRKINSQDQIALYLAPSQLITPLLSWGKAYERLKELKTKSGKVNQEVADFQLKSMQKTIQAWQELPAWFFTKNDSAPGLTLNGRTMKDIL